MFNSRSQSGAPHAEQAATGELQAIVGWLRGLPGEDIKALREALANHDAAHLADYVVRFLNCPKSATLGAAVRSETSHGSA